MYVRGGRPRWTFHSQVSLKSHGIYSQNPIYWHVINDNEPLKPHYRERSLFPPAWPITLKMEENLSLVLMSEFSPHSLETLVAGKIPPPLSNVPKWHTEATSCHPENICKGPTTGNTPQQATKRLPRQRAEDRSTLLLLRRHFRLTSIR